MTASYKYERPTDRFSVNLAQGFSRCVGIPYQLYISYCLSGIYDYDDSPDQLPIEFDISVGFNGSTPISTWKKVFSRKIYGQQVGECSGAQLLYLINPLSAPPSPWTDGLSITISESYGGIIELLVYNITMTAMSS